MSIPGDQNFRAWLRFPDVPVSFRGWSLPYHNKTTLLTGFKEVRPKLAQNEHDYHGIIVNLLETVQERKTNTLRRHFDSAESRWEFQECLLRVFAASH